MIGLWGILVLAPILRDHVEPALHSALGFIPLFGPPATDGSSIFTAIVVLTIMILPIIASISRELFLGVPRELKEGALALGTTRWEMIRGVVFPYARGGVAAAMILGFGRAIGEAIAVAQVIGGGHGHQREPLRPRRHARERDRQHRTRARRPGSRSPSLIYLALILLVFSLVVNLLAQLDRAARRRGAIGGRR